MPRTFEEREEELVLKDGYTLKGFEKWAYNTNAEDVKSHKVVIPLYTLGCDPWQVLISSFNFNSKYIRDFKRDLEYECPFTGNLFYRGLPVSFMSKRKFKLEEGMQQNRGEQFVNLLLDEEFFSDLPQDEENMTFFPMNCIYRSFLGHGFTSPHGPSKQSVYMKNYKVKISKTQSIIFKHWTWAGEET